MGKCLGQGWGKKAVECEQGHVKCLVHHGLSAAAPSRSRTRHLLPCITVALLQAQACTGFDGHLDRFILPIPGRPGGLAASTLGRTRLCGNTAGNGPESGAAALTLAGLEPTSPKGQAQCRDKKS
jgi:hypothetical protein